MYKSFKIKIGGSKSDCCTISIQEVQDNQDEKSEISKDCCEIKVDQNQSCCN